MELRTTLQAGDIVYNLPADRNCVKNLVKMVRERDPTAGYTLFHTMTKGRCICITGTSLDNRKTYNISYDELIAE